MIFLDDPVRSTQAHDLLKADNFFLLKSERWDRGKGRRDSKQAWERLDTPFLAVKMKRRLQARGCRDLQKLGMSLN